MADDGVSVRVAVRCRPFNAREKERGATVIIRMEGATTYIKNPETGEEKDFAFDFSYWSHDQFEVRPDGYTFPKPGSNYADQQVVFDSIGKDVMQNAFGGFNSCLFAYGQTGSGKSYSMVGYGANKGIVPITCDAIFQYVREKQSDKLRFEVSIEMLEIYNEQVCDLFVKEKVQGGLKVRMNPKVGVEVVGLTAWPVSSYKEIEERIETATLNRTVAATNMNATSSRAHTVVTISFTQIEVDAKGPGKHSQKKAKLNLVDLAGSERAESTGATGDRLKEGAAINLSLTMLGNCITALAEKSMNPKKNVLVPYRESKLTMILQDALGGNSKTIMICALSPADINYDETLGTLRYADRAKKIKNKPKVNIDATELLINSLKEENDRLKKLMESGQLGGGGGGSGMSEEEKAQMKAEFEAEVKANQEALERQLRESSMSFEQKMAEARAQIEAEVSSRKKDGNDKDTVPHILNIHEDVMMNHAVSHFFRPGKTLLGNRATRSDINIPLSGVSIKPLHATVENTDGTLIITPDGDAEVLINGEQASAGLELKHNDRIAIGSNYAFIVVHPEQRKLLGEEPQKEWDWTEFQREIAKARGITIGSNYANMTPEERRQALINDEIIQLLPLVKEANAMAQAMSRDIVFETEVIASNLAASGKSANKVDISVKVSWRPSELEFIWDRNKFMDRVFIIRELWQKFTDGLVDPTTMSQDDDPFWDPIEITKCGSCLVHPSELYYRMRKEGDFPIIGRNSERQGQLSVRLIPCFPDGREDDDEELFVEEPEQAGADCIIGHRLDIKVCIKHARGLNQKFSKLSQVRFKIFGQEEFATKSVEDTINPTYNFEQVVTWSNVTGDLLRFLKNEALEFEIWGLQEQKAAGQKGSAKRFVDTSEVERMKVGLFLSLLPSSHVLLTILAERTRRIPPKFEEATEFAVRVRHC
jgi:kinesin family protein 1